MPKAKRRYGYYVLPILHGESLVGRVAARLDRRRQILQIEGVYAEPEAPSDELIRVGIAAALRALARFCGARVATLAGPVPEVWHDVVPHSEEIS